VLSAREARQVRACYGAKLTMIDAWLGRVLDALDRRQLWQDTVVIVCTDHGHYLGEKDIFGKPAVPAFEPLAHMPLLVAWPGVAPRSVDALTTSIDLFATLAELFGVEPRHRTHGRSLAPLVHARAASIRDWALCGVWGREVHWIDGRRKYARAPLGENAPISLWSNRWSTMPVHGRFADRARLPLPDERAVLDRMPGSRVPVMRQPFGAGDRLPFWALGPFSGNHLYDLAEDPAEERNLVGSPLEKDAAEALRAALLAVEAPRDQLERLALA
jgi:arylsulfatase A-like enzyme